MGNGIYQTCSILSCLCTRQTTMNIFSTTSLAIITSAVISHAAVANTLTFSLPAGEGGSDSKRAISSFEHYMADNNCASKIVFSSDEIAADIYFSTAPPLPPTEQQHEYSVLARATSYNNQPLTTAILIKSSTGISNLASVENERLSIISKTSYLGWQEVKKLYQNAGVAIDPGDLYITGTYEGAIALLLHGDVFVAALPGPMARRWATANALSIIAESKPLDIGHVWVSRKLPASKAHTCREALLALKRSNRRDKRLTVFPGWVEGFR